jgi:hypothetical protein
MSNTSQSLIPHERIENKIFLIRGKKVMFDIDLAMLYGVPTKRLNEQVKRNSDRFPDDFMFKLSSEEVKNWRSQIETSNLANIKEELPVRSQIATASKRNLRFSPYVFTEQGVAMLSSVLKSKQAVQVNIQIMRTFTKIREMLVSNKDLREKIEKLEKKYDGQFRAVFDAIARLLAEEVKPRKEIGFKDK